MPTSPLRCALSTKTGGKDRLLRDQPQRHRPTSSTSFGGVGDAGAAASSREPPRSTIAMTKGGIRRGSRRLVRRVAVHLQLNIASVSLRQIPLFCDNRICHSDYDVWFRLEGAQCCATRTDIAQGSRPRRECEAVIVSVRSVQSIPTHFIYRDPKVVGWIWR
ncbi:hypothetical protein V8C34DRAFT_285594 [Trichoderma compactum]